MNNKHKMCLKELINKSQSILLLLLAYLILSCYATPGNAEPCSAVLNGEYISGEMIFINNQKLITADGRQVYFSDETVFYKNGIKSEIADLKTGRRVFLKTDPETFLADMVYLIDLKSLPADEPIKNVKVSKNSSLFSSPVSFKKGDKITVTAQGTRGLKLFFDVPAIVHSIPMSEVKPGNYKASFTFSYGDIRRAYAVVKTGDKEESSAKIYPIAFDVALTPPEIIPVLPGQGRTISGNEAIIFAKLYSPGSMINAALTSVKIDGRLITANTEKTFEFIKAEIPGSLAPGKHRVEVSTTDEAGNTSIKKWDFNYNR